MGRLKTPENQLATAESGESRKNTKGRLPRKVSEQYLRNAALYYLQRFSSSSGNLRTVLMRKVRRAAQVHETDMEACAAWIDQIIQRYQETGLLDDRAYAEAKARALRERGNSNRTIRMKLMAKGVDADVAGSALLTVADRDGNAETDAAVRFARRRRLGPFGNPDLRESQRNKGLASMARAGFSYDLAQQIIDAEPHDPIFDKASLDI